MASTDSRAPEVTIVIDDEGNLVDTTYQPPPPYDPSFTFERRICRAIWRYRKHKVLDHELRFPIFKEYMKFSHIDIGPRQFVKNPTEDDDYLDGAPPVDEEGMGIIKSPEDPHFELVVNFTECTKRFLSAHFIDCARFSTIQSFDVAADVVLGFLHYLLKLSVCPEYDADVRGAIEVAENARHELPACKRFSFWLPGKRDVAVSIMCKGGTYAGVFDVDDDALLRVQTMMGITLAEATEIAAALGNDAEVEFNGRWITLQLVEPCNVGVRCRVVKGVDDEFIELPLEDRLAEWIIPGLVLRGKFGKLKNCIGSPWFVEQIMETRTTYHTSVDGEEDVDFDGEDADNVADEWGTAGW